MTDEIKAKVLAVAAPLMPAAGVVGTITAEGRTSLYQWAQIGGVISTILLGVLGFLASVYYQSRENRRKDRESEIRIAMEKAEIEAKAHADRYAAAHNAVPKEKTTVLYVEDHPNTALAMRTTLERRGFEVIPANSLEVALACIQSGVPFDCALIDLNIPSVLQPTDATKSVHSPYGLLVLDALKDRPQLARVVMTGGDDDQIRQAQERGATVFKKSAHGTPTEEIIYHLRSVHLQEGQGIGRGFEELKGDE